MKRIFAHLLAVGLAFSASGAAAAADFRASGQWLFGFVWGDVYSQIREEKGDPFQAVQRLRTQIECIASEALKGVAFFEIGKSNWGDAADGASLGTDAANIKVRYSYVDWTPFSGGAPPHPKLRLGLQPFNLPAFVNGSPILSDDGAGIVASCDITPRTGATLFWMRPSNDNRAPGARGGKRLPHDAADLFALALPIRGEGFRASPYVMYGSVGINSLGYAARAEDGFSFTGYKSALRHMANGLTPAGGSRLLAQPDVADALSGEASVWWAGIGGETTLFSPFRLGAEFAFGHADFGTAVWNDRSFAMKRAGWYTALIAECKLEKMTPSLLFWYASGDDGNPYNGSERMPTAKTSNRDWKVLGLAYDGVPFCPAKGAQILSPDGSMTGTWGIVAALKDIRFTDALKHLFRVGYVRGVNNSAMVKNTSLYADDRPGGYLTRNDHALEADFETSCKLSDNLTLILDTACLRVDWDNAAWKYVNANLERDYYRAGLTVWYSF